MPNETNNLPDINPDIPNNEAVSKEIPLPEEAVPAACEPDCESAPETAVCNAAISSSSSVCVSSAFNTSG